VVAPYRDSTYWKQSLILATQERIAMRKIVFLLVSSMLVGAHLVAMDDGSNDPLPGTPLSTAKEAISTFFAAKIRGAPVSELL